MAKEPKTPKDPSEMGRIRQLLETYRMAKKSDRWIGLWILGAFLLAGAAGFALFIVLPGSGLLNWVLGVVGALMFGVLAALIVFGRRAQRAAYKPDRGPARRRPRPRCGCCAAAGRPTQRSRSPSSRTSCTASSARPASCWSARATPTGFARLMANERRKHERVAADTPIHEVICGNGEGEVPLPKLVRHVQKLGRAVKPAEMTDVLNRLKALDAQRSTIPLPKGPVPTSMKGMRGQLRGR